MTVVTIVDVHPRKDIVEEHERNFSEIHVIEVHDGDILLVMIGSHFEIHHNEQQKVDTVEIFVHFQGSFTFIPLVVFDGGSKFISSNDENRMHLPIKAIRVDETHLQSLNGVPCEFGYDFVGMKLLQLQQPLKCLFVVELDCVKMFQNDLIGKILHHQMLVQMAFYVFNRFIFLISVENFPINMSFLLAISHISKDLIFGNYDLHDFGWGSKAFEGVLFEKFLQVIFLDFKQHIKMNPLMFYSLCRKVFNLFY